MKLWKVYFFSKRKIRNSNLQISSLALYHLSYPGSIDGTGLNFSIESNAMQGIVVYDTAIIWLAN